MIIHSSVEPLLQNTTGVDLNRVEEETVSFQCTADGFPAPDIIWIANGQLVVPSLSDRFTVERKEVEISFRPNTFARVSQFNIRNLSPRDTGVYACRADIGIGQPDVIDVPFNLNVTESEYSILC